MKKRFTLAVLAAVCCLVSNAGGYSIESLVGTYVATSTSGWECISTYGQWTKFSTWYDVTISKNESGTVSITNLLGLNQTLEATLDVNTKTVSIAPQTYYWYYTLADSTDATKSIIGTIDNNGDIKFTNFNAWYQGDTYFADGAEVTLVKDKPGTVEWTVDGTLTYTNGSTGGAYHTAKTTLSKYNGATKCDYTLTFDGTEAAPTELKIKVFKDGDSIVVTNGYQTPGYDGGYFYYTYDDGYCIWLEGNTEASYLKGDKDGGTLSMQCYDYTSAEDEEGITGKFVFTWGTSGIKKIAADKANAPVYDLMGRKVTTLKAGLYIQNGKKFVVK